MNQTPIRVATWVRLALVALAVPNLATGAWAVLDPHGWFDRFPGFDPRLVAAEPPFNEHLATDAGAGLLASGMVLLVAAWFGDSRSVRLGLVAYGTFAIPHAAWHTMNPSEPLTAAEDVQNATTLLFAAIATIGLYVYVARQESRTATNTDPRAPEVAA